jgi:hypothetical protein
MSKAPKKRTRKSQTASLALAPCSAEPRANNEADTEHREWYSRGWRDGYRDGQLPANNPGQIRTSWRPLCMLAECPPGLFRYGRTLGFKSEYGDVYCTATGEAFWGGTTNAATRNALMVLPIYEKEDGSPSGAAPGYGHEWTIVVRADSLQGAKDAVWSCWDSWDRGAEPIGGHCPEGMGHRMSYDVTKTREARKPNIPSEPRR